MKAINILVSICLTSFPFVSLAASPQEEARVIATVKEAYASKAFPPLFELYYLVGVPESLIDRIADEIDSGFQGKGTISEIRFIEPDPNFLTHLNRGGVTYKPTLPITRSLEVRFAGAANKGTTFQVGEKDGRLYLVAVVPTK